MASWGFKLSISRETVPKRSIPVLVTNTPPVGRLGAQSGERAWGSEPRLSRTRKWTQPQERRKARGGVGEEEVLKGRKVKLPYRRASSRERMRLRDWNSAIAERHVFPSSCSERQRERERERK